MQSARNFVPVSPVTPTPFRSASVEERSKSWCFTLNNYQPHHELDIQLLKHDCSVSYLIYGREVGEAGNPHLQGFIHFKKRRSFGVVRLLLPLGCHLEAARGSPYQAAAYCAKDDPQPFEFVNLI